MNKRERVEPRSFAVYPSTLEKLDDLAGEYRLSRSGMLRSLVSTAHAEFGDVVTGDTEEQRARIDAATKEAMKLFGESETVNLGIG